MALQKRLEAIPKDDLKSIDKFLAIVNELVAAADAKGLNAFASYIVQVGESNNLLSKPVLKGFVAAVDKLPADQLAALEQVARATIDLLKNKPAYADELLESTRQLSEVHQARRDYLDAAKVRASVDLNNYRGLTAEFKLDWLIEAAELFMAADDTVAGSSMLTLCHREVNEVKNETEKGRELLVRYNVLYARICDAERKFQEAAMRYMQLSQIDGKDDDVMISLENAITCAILAPAGPGRSRVLGILYRDERAPRSQNFKILEKVFKDRILRASEVAKFEKTLQPHQNAKLAGALTVLKRAMNEHNLLAASHLYNNIKFEELGVLLDLEPHAAEQVAWRMIESGRLKAVIDQIEGAIEFESNTDTLSVWDTQIGGVCSAVNSVLDSIAKKYPKYVLP